jgi:hypothetical protein
MMLIQYSNGKVLQGIVLSFGDQVVRVAIKDASDAAEYRLVNGRWVSEDCEVVRFELLESADPIPSEDDEILEPLFVTQAGRLPVQRVM